MGLTTQYSSLGQPINKLSARGMVTEDKKGWIPVLRGKVGKNKVLPIPKFRQQTSYRKTRTLFESVKARDFEPRIVYVQDLRFNAKGWRLLFKALAEHYLVVCCDRLKSYARGRGNDNHWLSCDPAKLKAPYLVPGGQGIYIDLFDYECSEYYWRIKHLFEWVKVPLSSVEVCGRLKVVKYERIEE